MTHAYKQKKVVYEKCTKTEGRKTKGVFLDLQNILPIK